MTTICTGCSRKVLGSSADPKLCVDLGEPRVLCSSCAKNEDGAFQYPSFLFQTWVETGDSMALLEWRWRQRR